MIPHAFLDQLSSSINKLLPEDLPQNVASNLRALIESSFAQLDLVTREEFDAQKEVLLRTREKVNHLQQQLLSFEENNSD